ncbi:MAG: hypothetical protein JXA69_05040 [Phycisphaerae bacterium]|nr:hypothetical protein [Phycisphaerae bacterium]
MRCSRPLGGLLVVAVAVCLAMAPVAQAGQLGKVYASDGVAGMNFGSAAGISGNTIVVGATDVYVGEQRLGAAYVYTNNGASDWGGEVKLFPTDTTGIGDFGNGVAIDGDTIIIGANKSTVGGVEGAGTAHIFESDGFGGWTEVAVLTAGLDAISDIGFGTTVAISGDVAVVGASRYDEASSNQGAVYVFGRDEGGTNNWGQITRLTASDPSNNAYFGVGVDVDGDTAITGAYGASKVYILGNDPLGWAEMTSIASTSGTRFGIDVSIDGDTVVSGAYYRTIDGTSRAGGASIFSRDQGGENAWGEVADIVSPHGEANGYFGRSVTIDAGMIVAGAYGEDAGGVVDAGAAYVFRDDGSYLGMLLPDDPAEGDSFGRMVAISGDTIVVTATVGDGVVDDTGAVYIYSIPTPIPGDTNGDNAVDADDAAVLAAHWLQQVFGGATDGDFNKDRVVDDLDVAILAANWHPNDGAPVPEPGVCVLLLSALAVLWRLR